MVNTTEYKAVFLPPDKYTIIGYSVDYIDGGGNYLWYSNPYTHVEVYHVGNSIGVYCSLESFLNRNVRIYMMKI